MFLEDTTFVIGAGASTEYGKDVFPVGSGLRTLIERGFDFSGRLQWGETATGDRKIFNKLRYRYRDRAEELNQRINSALLIKDHLYMFPSIDAFIDHYSDETNSVAEMGKLAIAMHIARAERRSLLAPDPDRLSYSFEITKLSKTWIEPFARILMDNVRDPARVGEGVSIICFNYDRSIEFYLIEALRRRYGIDYAEARRIVGAMNIIHPYGTLGALPETEGGHDAKHPNFGPDVDERFDPWDIIPSIKTYTERLEEGAVLQSIKTAMAACRHLIFLGFGFTTENLKLLSTVESAPKPDIKHMVISTGVGIPQQAVPALTGKIATLFANPNGTQWQGSAAVEVGMDCATLLNSYYLALQR